MPWYDEMLDDVAYLDDFLEGNSLTTKTIVDLSIWTVDNCIA